MKKDLESGPQASLEGLEAAPERTGNSAELSEDEASWGPTPGANPPALPRPASELSGRLAGLAETAKAYARSAQADNTRRASAIAKRRRDRILAYGCKNSSDSARIQP